MAQAPTRIHPHLSYEELEQRYKRCDDTRQQRYWHLIWLMANPEDPKVVSEAARLSGWSINWARELVRRYNQVGPDGFYDKRADNPGARPYLTEAQKEELREAVMSGTAPDGGLWTSVKVADWIEKKTGRRPDDRSGLNYLHDLGFTLQIPRPRHTNAPDKAAVSAFKKSSSDTVAGSNVVFQTEW